MSCYGTEADNTVVLVDGLGCKATYMALRTLALPEDEQRRLCILFKYCFVQDSLEAAEGEVDGLGDGSIYAVLLYV